MLAFVQIVNWLAQYKPKQLTKQGLVKPVAEALLRSLQYQLHVVLCADSDLGQYKLKQLTKQGLANPVLGVLLCSLQHKL